MLKKKKKEQVEMNLSLIYLFLKEAKGAFFRIHCFISINASKLLISHKIGTNTYNRVAKAWPTSKIHIDQKNIWAIVK